MAIKKPGRGLPGFSMEVCRRLPVLFFGFGCQFGLFFFRKDAGEDGAGRLYGVACGQDVPLQGGRCEGCEEFGGLKLVEDAGAGIREDAGEEVADVGAAFEQVAEDAGQFF